MHKNRTCHQDGFKGHVSFEPETGLFTEVALTRGSGPESHDAAVAEDLLADEDASLTVLGDSAYGTGHLRAHLAAAGHTAVIKPPPVRQAVPGGFTVDDFILDTGANTATCPAGHTVAVGRPRPDGGRIAQFKGICMTSKTGGTLNIHPQQALLAAARHQAATDLAWQDEYRRRRPPVERRIAWIVAHGNRRVPYRGVLKNDTCSTTGPPSSTSAD